MSAPARILVRSPNWLGDAVMALPFLGDLRRHYPDARIVVAAPAPLQPFYDVVREVDAVVPLDDGSGGWRGWHRDVARLRDAAPDVAVLLTNSFGSALQVRRAGIPQRWGYRADLRGVLLTRGVRRAPGAVRRRQHHSEYYRQLGRALAIEAGGGDRSPRAEAAARPTAGCLVDVPGSVATRGLQLLTRLGFLSGRQRLVGIAIGAANGHAKQWPPDRVAGLTARLVQMPDVVCLLLGSPGDRPVARTVHEELDRLGTDDADAVDARRSRVLDLVGRTDLSQLIGVLSHCRVVVSNDSGGMHLAAAVGAHVVAIFGPTNEIATSPLGDHRVLLHDVRCRPCMLRECPIDHRCMKGVTVDMVTDAVVAGLAHGHRADGR